MELKTRTLLHSLQLLSTYQIVLPHIDSHYKINPTFQANLQLALVGGGSHKSFGEPADSKDKHGIDLEFLDKYAEESWESVLHYLVGTPSEKVCEISRIANICLINSTIIRDLRLS
jgi:transcription initiation factor TFIIH subunit 4